MAHRAAHRNNPTEREIFPQPGGLQLPLWEGLWHYCPDQGHRDPGIVTCCRKLELKLNVLFRYSKRTRKIPWRFLFMWKTSRRWGTTWDTLWPLSTWEPWGLTSLWLSATSSSHFSVVLLKITIHYVDPMTSFTIICPNDWVTRPVVSFNLH